MAKKVLITGANGFIGNFLARQVKKMGLHPYAGVRIGADLSGLKELDVDVVYLEYDLIDKLAEVLDHYRFDYIIHNAGMTRSPSLKSLIKVNKSYLENLVMALKICDHKIDKLLFVSSLAAFGPADDLPDGIVTLNTTPKPLTNYGRSKLMADQYLSDQADIPWLIIRPTSVYGPGEKDFLTVFQTINKGLDLVAGSIPQKLTFIYVEDLARLMVQMVTSTIVHKSYFASDGTVNLDATFTDIIKTALNRKTIRIRIPLYLVRTMGYISEKFAMIVNKYPVLNIDKAKEIKARNWNVDISETIKDFQFSPNYSLEQGVKLTTDWYKANKWL